MSKKHLIIPDVQAKPGNDFTFLNWIGQYIIDQKPDVIVNIGDFADMPSLSSYDVGKKSFEGRRYVNDIAAAKEAMDSLMTPLRKFNIKARKNKEKQYKPKMVLTLGNHEQRISRAIENDPKLEGLIKYEDLPYNEWEVQGFLEPVCIDGVYYSHYFPTGAMGRPCSSASAMVSKLHASCVAGHQQGKQITYGKKPDGSTITCIIAGSCLHPSHKILTADLRYIKLQDLKIGDKVVSFDELPNVKGGTRKSPRRFKTGTVKNLRLNYGEMFDVTLSSGKVFRVTKDHKWFTKNSGSLYSWITTENLRKTKETSLGKSGGGTRIVKLLDEFEHDTSWESGWLAGMYCGEGSLYHRTTSGGSVMQLSLCQSQTHNPKTCDRIVSALEQVCGVTVDTKSRTRNILTNRIVGGTRNIATVLGTLRPPRMLDKFIPEMLGGIGNKTQQEAEHIVSIVPVGMDEYIEVDIDEKTMIVEGYGHHNCYEHDEDYMDRLSNKHWRGVVVLHEVQDGTFDEMFVSLRYLEKKYGNTKIT